jgi:hypothetical protein
MRAHDHDAGVVDGLRPKAARIDDETTLHARAASEGRWDAVGADGMAQLQRSTGNAGVVAALQRSHDGHDHAAHEDEPSPVHDVVSSGGGRPLEPEVRADMEGRLGHDFGDVRVHDDGKAHDSAKAVQAHAYTAGSNVVFQRGGYDPSSDSGRLTLAHELTHVVQQRSGPVDGTPAAGGIRISDPDDRFEREASANAERVMSAPAPTSSPGASPAAAGGPVQRQAEDEEEAVQGSFVQRQGEEDEEEAVQGSFVQRQGEEDEEEAVQGSFVQRQAEEEEPEDVQGSFEPGAVQRDEAEEEDQGAG